MKQLEGNEKKLFLKLGLDKNQVLTFCGVYWFIFAYRCKCIKSKLARIFTELQLMQLRNVWQGFLLYLLIQSIYVKRKSILIGSKKVSHPFDGYRFVYVLEFKTSIKKCASVCVNPNPDTNWTSFVYYLSWTLLFLKKHVDRILLLSYRFHRLYKTPFLLVLIFHNALNIIVDHPVMTRKNKHDIRKI